MNINLKRIVTGVVGALVACAALAGCSSSPSATTTATSHTSTTSSSTRTTITIPGATTIPFVEKYNARQDVTTTSCQKVLGVWQIKGNIKNSASDTRNYEIVVDYVTQPGDTVQDTKIVHVSKVAPGSTVAWSSTGAPGKSNLACVIRFVQAYPAS